MLSERMPDRAESAVGALNAVVGCALGVVILGLIVALSIGFVLGGVAILGWAWRAL